MKKLALVLAGFIACAVLNAAPVVYVVNMGEVYRNYYKAKEAIAQINNAKEAATQELAKMDKSRQEIMKKIEGDYKVFGVEDGAVTERKESEV